MAKKIQVELTDVEAHALMASRVERDSTRAAEKALDDAQLKVAEAMLKTNHGR